MQKPSAVTSLNKDHRHAMSTTAISTTGRAIHNGSDSSTSPQYGPRLYANFKPTAPPADPSSIVFKLKRTMLSTTSKDDTMAHSNANPLGVTPPKGIHPLKTASGNQNVNITKKPAFSVKGEKANLGGSDHLMDKFS